jgi:rubrerythrin
MLAEEDSAMEEAKKKPSYLGLLNAVALAEGRAHEYLKAWAAKTPDPAVREVLMTVAIREGEHSHAFTKRLCELGYSVLDRPDPTFEKNMAIACADCPDVEKFEALGYRATEPEDRFARFFDDTSIDPQTGELLGRYISEERDSGRRLRACYAALSADRAPRAAAPGREMRELHERLDEICAAIGKLQTEVASLSR